MSTFNDKTLRSVADAVMKVMDEELKGNQHKIDANKNNKIDAHDFKLLRKKKLTEDLLSESASWKTSSGGTITTTKTGVRHTGKYGTSHYDEAKPKKEAPAKPAAKELTDDEFKAKHGMSRKNYERMKSGVKIGEEYGFLDLINMYEEYGLAAITAMTQLVEEPTEEEFNAELKIAQAKAEGKGPKAKVADAAVKGVKVQEDVDLSMYTIDELEEFLVSEEFEQLDEISKQGLQRYIRASSENLGSHAFKGGVAHRDDDTEARAEHAKKEVKRQKGIMTAARKLAKEEVELDERSLTSDEKAEMEKNVKGMKKKLSSFKARYGDKAKSVMYATATKMAKED